MPNPSKTSSQKAALRAQHVLKPYWTLTQLAEWFKQNYNETISESTVSRTLSPRYAYLDNPSSQDLKQTRRRIQHWPELEASLFEWIQRAEGRVPITQDVVRMKAMQFWARLYPEKNMPRFSNGWLHRFQARRNIKCRDLHGEGGSLSESAATEMIGIRQALQGYAPQDIFNCDETGLNWRLFPDRSLTTGQIPGRKKEKARITAHFCCNSDGSERLPIWFIGTAKQPRAFRAARINVENLGCFWRYNKTAWMTGTIFKEWLLWFDRKMTGRKVVLLMDNFSAHETAFEEIGHELQNTFLVWLPANSTTRYQPLDQGIISTWKTYWKRHWVSFMVEQFDNGFNPISTMTILRAVRWGISIWNLEIQNDTIKNCFQKALTIEDTQQIANQELTKEIENGLQQLHFANHIRELMDINQFLNPVEETVDDSILDIDDAILIQYEPGSELSEDEDEFYEPLPLIPASEALESLHKLRLFEEQQIEGNTELIQLLTRYEKTLIQKKVERQRQTDIRMFYG